MRQAKRTPGNLGVRVRKTNRLAFWTLAMWRDNQAIKTFVPASPHREAMQKLPHWCDEAAFARLGTGDHRLAVLGNGRQKIGGQRSLS
jgi:hypothetical protein